MLHALGALAPCDVRFVVTGASGRDVAALLPAGVRAVENPAHAAGMSTSLRAGLRAVLADPHLDAALVLLVDLPDVGVAVVERVLAAAPPTPTVLARASFAGRPGHPVLLGRAHLPGVLAAAAEDEGARRYLADRDVLLVEAGDLAGGADVDEPGRAAD